MRTSRAVRALAAGVAAVLLATTAAFGATTAQVLAAVKASVAVQKLPLNISPSLSDATMVHSTAVDGAAWILDRCDPYMVPAQAAKPVPCVYGDTKSRKVVVLFGDSNAGSWAPAFDTMFKQMHYKLDLFGFIGCTTAPVTETSSQPGFPAQYQLCNTWHHALPAAVRAVRPVAIIEAASPWWPLTPAEVKGWVPAMASAFNQMTKGHPKTIRMEMGTTPLFPTSVPTCLAGESSSIQLCGVDYSSPTSDYAQFLARDAAIAVAAHAKLIPSWQWLCLNSHCTPAVKNLMTVVDRDHTSTPFVNYIEGAVKAAFTKSVHLP